MTQTPVPPGSPVEVAVAAVPADAYLLDVREQHEWVQAHAPQAVPLPMSAIVARVGEIPRDRTVYVFCHSGNRSAQVVAWLRQQGYDATNVTGGIVAWSAAGLPLVAGE